MTDKRNVDYESEIPEILTALVDVETVISKQGIDRSLIHLIKLRASQINKCAYCVKMHTQEARADGETNERLDRLVVWRQVDDFTEAEKAALAWTEALTSIKPENDLDPLRADLRKHYSEKEIGVITATVAMINMWNRFGITRH